jgi:2,3-dihydroxybiphenyl 1,2-dioxygenase
MSAVSQLGYIGISASDVGEWESYATGVLGLRAAGTEKDKTLLLGMDGHHHRFAIHPDGKDDVDYIGWEVEGKADLDAIAGRLEGAGVAVAAGSKEFCERRRVAGVIRFQDPDGHSVEVFHGAQAADGGFESPKGASGGFVADGMGLGHLVLAADNLDRAMAFYQEMLGMKVSDYVKQGRTTLGFLHCNPRHHSIAFVELPGAKKRINHFMLQLESMDDVGRTYDQVQQDGVPLLVTLGRHSNDRMVSFYMANPSRFGVEYGWGAREIDDCAWTVEHYDSGTIWGHHRAPAVPPRS